jgi:hypothetical protein
MDNKQPEPWSPRWVREKLREFNNGLPPNDLNHDEKPPAGAKPPLCKRELECHCYYSLDYDTYDWRYWGCKLSVSPFNWGWDEEQPRKVVSILSFIITINNVVINRIIFL